MGNLALNGADKQQRNLLDQINKRSRQRAVLDGKFPGDLKNGDGTTRLDTANDSIIIGQSDGKSVAEFEIKRGVTQYFTTSSATVPTTTQFPANGDWGWHLNTATSIYYIARNYSGTIQSTTLNGTSGAITAAQHGTLGAPAAHPFTVITGVISDAQHGSKTLTTLHAVATGAAAGFMSAADKGALDDITTTGDAVNLLNGTEIQVEGTKVVGARITGWGDASGTTSRAAFNVTDGLTTIAEHLGALINDLKTHGIIGT